MKALPLLLLITCFLSTVSAAKPVDSTMIILNREISVLRQMMAEKLDQLESTETRRWNNRYQQNQEVTLLESQARQLETGYATIAAQLNRKQEDVLLLGNVLDEEIKSLNDKKQQYTAFALQVRQVFEENAAKLASDFPDAIAERTAQYSAITDELFRRKEDISAALSTFIDMKMERIALSRSQELTTRAVLFNDGIERTVWNLRFGTIFMIDIDKDSTAYQMLMHTGALQGQRYTWRTAVSETMYHDAMALVAAIQNSQPARVPLDVLQNGKIGTASDPTASNDRIARFKTWFGQGGLIMYPLFFCALLAIILALERFITLSSRSFFYRRSYNQLLPLIGKGAWAPAMAYCKKRGSSLTRAIEEILHRRTGSREQAEQHVKQILLGEVPSLEKRMSIIAALGATAPLLGLLGTVSGMITLFKVITETGTNDARILAGGIAEALITTQTGLFIAIPILLIHGYLSERLENILSHYNETVLEVFNLVFNDEKQAE